MDKDLNTILRLRHTNLLTKDDRARLQAYDSAELARTDRENFIIQRDAERQAKAMEQPAAEKLAEAQSAYNAAVQRHDAACAAVNEANAAVTKAASHKDALLARVADGADDVTDADLLQADADRAKAEATAALAQARKQATKVGMDRAHIALLAANAEALQAEHARTVDVHIEIAAAVDEAYSELKDLLDAFRKQGQAVRVAYDAMSYHNERVVDPKINGNAILAGQHPSVWPKCRLDDGRAVDIAAEASLYFFESPMHRAHNRPTQITRMEGRARQAYQRPVVRTLVA